MCLWTCLRIVMPRQSVVRVKSYERLHQDIKQTLRFGRGDYYMPAIRSQRVSGRTAPLVYDLAPGAQMECSFRVLTCESLVREEQQTRHEHHKDIGIRVLGLEIVDVPAHQTQRFIVLLESELSLCIVRHIVNCAM